jgi:soluble lytic murein transglycosylase-like protein
MLGILLGVAASMLASSAMAGETHLARPPADPKAIIETVNRLAPSYGLDPALVRAIILAESAYDPNAVSPRNAQGIMQLTPETATRFGVSDPFDPAQNLRGGMSYLRWLIERFNGNLALTLAAYNAGEGAVLQYGGIPPYRETQDYVARVQQYVAGGASDLAALPARRHLAAVYRASARGGWHVGVDGAPTMERARSGVMIFRGGGPS